MFNFGIAVTSMIGLMACATPSAFAQPVTSEDRPSLFDQAVARAELPDDNKRISGGNKVSFNENKWQVAILVAEIKNNLRAQFCGGTVVAEQWILTAAHCIDKKKAANKYDILVGTDTLAVDCCRLPAIDYIIHPQYDARRKDGVSKHDYDIALIKVDTSKKSIKEYIIDLYDHDSPVGKDMRATGWGVTERRYSPTVNLLGVMLPVIDNDICNLKKSYDKTVTENMFCAGDEMGKRDTCKGDSGGPGTVEYNGKMFLIGVTSWGDSCGKLFKYGVYTRVHNFKSWIKEVTTEK